MPSSPNGIAAGDIDGDGKVAKGVTPIESIGSMALGYENDSTARLRVNGFVVNAGAGGVSYSSYVLQGYTAVAADVDARTGQPTIVWRYASGSTEFLTFWRLNTSWNSIASDGQAFRDSSDYYTAEMSFGIDFDGDGRIGVPSQGPSQGPKVIEQQGTVSLTIDATGNLNANGIGVKAHGSSVSFSGYVAQGYTAVAAENLLGQNTIVWRHTTGFLHFWQFDSAWNYTLSYGAATDGGDDFHVTESRYGTDFNGDKSIGLRRGLVAQIITPRSDQTLFAYNAASQAVFQASAGLPDGAVTRYSSYDNRGNLTGQIDANGNAATFAYDALNRQTTATAPDPDGPGPLTAVVTAFSFDRSGNLLAATLSSGIATRSVFDKRDRETRSIGPDGTYTLATFDAAGNKVAETDALGRTTRYKYDSRNRLSATLLPDGSSTRTTFDGGGRLVARADGNGATNASEYDKLGRKTRETQPDPDAAGPLAAPVTAWGYDSRGNVEFVTPLFVRQGGVTAGDGNRSTHYTYDALGRVLSETQPDPDGSGPMSRPVTLFGYQDTGLAGRGPSRFSCL
jgi:YD repeat-containing protein